MSYDLQLFHLKPSSIFEQRSAQGYESDPTEIRLRVSAKHSGNVTVPFDAENQSSKRENLRANQILPRLHQLLIKVSNNGFWYERQR